MQEVLIKILLGASWRSAVKTLPGLSIPAGYPQIKTPRLD